MSSIEHQMTESYCLVDEFLKSHPAQARRLRSPYGRPLFTDAEVITSALLQDAFGCATLKRGYELVRDNWRPAFPHLASYQQWLARLHALSGLTGQFARRLARPRTGR